MARYFVNPPEIHPPIMEYSHAVVADKTIYVSSQFPLDKDGELVGCGDPTKQAVQVFENLSAVLSAAGAELKDVVRLTTYLTDLSYRIPVMEVRNQYFGAHRAPSIMAVVPDLPVQGALLEVDAIAVVD